MIGVILGVVWVHMTGRVWCGPSAERKREEGAQRYGMRRTCGVEAIRAKRSARGAEAKAGGERGQAEMAAWRRWGVEKGGERVSDAGGHSFIRGRV